MRKVLCMLFLGLLIPVMVAAQEVKTEEANQSSSFLLGFHFGLHFFNPEDVNDYIAHDLESYMIEAGSSDMFMAYDLGIDSRYMFNNYLGIKCGFDWLLSPKYVTGDVSEFYFLSGICFSAMGVVVIPAGDDLSLLIGAGPDYYYSWFEEFSGYGPGGRMQLGIVIDEVELSAVIRYASIPNKKKVNGAGTPDFDMNFSGLELRATVFFSI